MQRQAVTTHPADHSPHSRVHLVVRPSPRRASRSRHASTPPHAEYAIPRSHLQSQVSSHHRHYRPQRRTAVARRLVRPCPRLPRQSLRRLASRFSLADRARARNVQTHPYPSQIRNQTRRSTRRTRAARCQRRQRETCAEDCESSFRGIPDQGGIRVQRAAEVSCGVAHTY